MKMLNLTTIRNSNQYGLPDLLPWGVLIEPGIVMCKDGSLLAGWRVIGKDIDSSSKDEIEVGCARANEALRLLGTGWMLHVSVDRCASETYPSRESSQYPDSVTQMIDDERRALFEGGLCYSSSTIMCLTYKPSITESNIAKHVQGGEATKRDLYSETRKTFNNTLQQVEDVLSSVYKMDRLMDYRVTVDNNVNIFVSDLLRYLQLCVTGQDQFVQVPYDGAYLDAVLGAEDLTLEGYIPKLGDRYISVVSLNSFPMHSWPSMLDAFDSEAMTYRFVWRFICLDQTDALKEINKLRKGWSQSMYKIWDIVLRNTNARINRDAAMMHEDAEQALQEVQSGMVGVGYLSASVVLMNEDLQVLEDQARQVRRLFQKIGATGYVESLNTLEAWRSTHPGNGDSNIRRPLVNTMNLADLLPLSSIYSGKQYNPCNFYPHKSRCLAVLQTANSPYRLNLHEGDVAHTMILGPTGSGKSTLLALLAAQFRCYPNSTIFVFDKGYSMYPLTKGAGGDHFDVGRDERLAFAPLQRIDESREEFAWAATWLSGMAELQKVVVTAKHTQAIAQALVSLSNNPPHLRSLTHFWHVLQHPELKVAFQPYIQGGIVGHLLDSEKDNLQFSRFMCFETETLMQMGTKNMAPVLSYIFHRIEGALNGPPGMLIVDEAWAMLDNELFRGNIREWLKTFRRKNTAVVMATQSISDAASSGIMDVIMESCPTKIFLANAEAQSETSANLYKAAGLNDTQIGIIKYMTPKRDYYIVQPSGRRQVQLALHGCKKTLAFIGASDRDSLRQLNAIMEKYPDNWREMWLRERGAI